MTLNDATPSIGPRACAPIGDTESHVIKRHASHDDIKHLAHRLAWRYNVSTAGRKAAAELAAELGVDLDPAEADASERRARARGPNAVTDLVRASSAQHVEAGVHAAGRVSRGLCVPSGLAGAELCERVPRGELE